jgi:hypothetical protein
MPNIAHTHPTTHKRIANTYFISNTIKLHPEYQHLASFFSPILKQDHPLHQQSILTFPHLHQYIQTQNQPPLPHLLYVIIVTINPSIDTCNNILARPNDYQINLEWINTLINKLANLTNPPERHIHTLHPYTKFIESHQDIIEPPNSIHKDLYTFIHSHETPPTLTVIQRKFSFLPHELIKKSLRCFETPNEFANPPPLLNIPTQTTRINNNTNHETNIITWNASSLNTTLPNLQGLISYTQTNTTIITIQETKLDHNNKIHKIYSKYIPTI